jgi:cytochrome c
MKTLNIAAALTMLAAPAFAEGDAAAGEEQFNRQCVSCHVVADADGNVLAGRAAKTGPNLFGVAGRVPGTVDGFR